MKLDIKEKTVSRLLGGSSHGQSSISSYESLIRPFDEEKRPCHLAARRSYFYAPQ